jgi:hypothetical protein
VKTSKSPTIRIKQKEGFISAKLLAFYPNLRSGKNCGYAIVSNDKSIPADENLIHPDETGKYLYINELALTLSTRTSLHKQCREKNDKPLILDERAASVKFVWQ